MIQKLSSTNNYLCSTSTADQRQVTYVGDPDELKAGALRLPKTMVPTLKNRLLTFAAMLQLTFCQNRPREYFGTQAELAVKAGLSVRTTKDHLTYLAKKSPPGIDQRYITKIGRYGRRTVTYQIDKAIRKLANGDHFLLPVIARDTLQSWSAKLLFAHMTNRWLVPIHVHEIANTIGADVGHKSEDIEVFHNDYGTAAFRVVPTAATLGLQRSTVYRAIREIEEYGLSRFESVGDRTQFSLNVTQ